MPTIDLTDAEHATVIAAIRRAIEKDRFPRTPRLDSLRSALAKLDPAAAAALRRPLTPKRPTPPKRPPTGLLGPTMPNGQNAAHGGDASREAMRASGLNVR